MSGREIARQLLGVPGKIRAQPITAETLGRITGRVWSPARVGPASMVAVWQPGRFPSPEWWWQPREVPSYPDLWSEDLLASRQDRWVLLVHPHPGTEVLFFGVRGFSSPELDRSGAERAWRFLRQQGLRIILTETNNPVFQFVLQSAGGQASNNYGLLVDLGVPIESLDPPPGLEDQEAMLASEIMLNGAIVTLLRRMESP